MKDYKSLYHTRWDCKYHVVFIPKRRKKKINGALRRQLGTLFLTSWPSRRRARFLKGIFGRVTFTCS